VKSSALELEYSSACKFLSLLNNHTGSGAKPKVEATAWQLSKANYWTADPKQHSRRKSDLRTAPHSTFQRLAGSSIIASVIVIGVGGGNTFLIYA
jgi:hypothetical protein